MEEQDRLELEVRRILASEIQEHGNQLRAQFRILTWAVSALLFVALGIFYFFFGDSVERIEEVLSKEVNDRFIEYRMDDFLLEKLRLQTDNAVQNAVDSKETKQRINESIRESTVDALESVKDEVEDKVIRTVGERINEMETSQADRIIAKVSMPSGAVLAFNRETCPPGWTEYALAYGRFIRGIDRGGEDLDPEGERKPGSIQDEDFLAHSHTRPKDVYDAGNNPDASWVAHEKYFGYGHARPPMTGKSGGIETRPDNVALLYCEKV